MKSFHGVTFFKTCFGNLEKAFSLFLKSFSRSTERSEIAQIKAEIVILSNMSPYFDTNLQSNFREKQIAISIFPIRSVVFLTNRRKKKNDDDCYTNKNLEKS